MKIKDLKFSLSKLTADFDDMEVLIQYVNENGKTDYDCLAFTGYVEDPMAFILGTNKSADKANLKDGQTNIKKRFKRD